jgi:tetratricopeptide (TPR) repeat protein
MSREIFSGAQIQKGVIMKKILKSFFVFCAMIFFASCSSYNSVKRMQRMEEGVANPTTKEELEEAIKKYEKRAMDLALTDGQVGIWYKILGTRYLDQRLYGKAMECFKNAVAYYPDNANLYYYVAICAGYMAHTELDYEGNGASSAAIKKMNYLKLAENSYLQAISINPNYYRALYGIGVLYVFEFGEDEKAIPYLEKFLSTQLKDTDAMFVLARAYYSTYQYEKAVSLYDKIIELKPNAEKVQEAQANKSKVLEAQYQ